jgi:hypothetical protein
LSNHGDPEHSGHGDSADLQPFSKCLDDAGGLALLHEAQHGVDDQRTHHGEIEQSPEHVQRGERVGD